MMVLAAGAAVGQTIGPATPEEVQKHIAVLKSSAGRQKLGRPHLGAIGTKTHRAAGGVLDEKLSM
jgi:hypothetical protein